MNLNIQDFKAIQAVKILDSIEMYKEYGDRFIILEEIDYVSLYVLLKTKFGPPNGLLSILRNKGSDNLFHWNYTISNGKYLLDIIYSFRNLEIRFVVSKSDSYIIIKNAILKMLKDEIKKNKKLIIEKKSNLEHWELFQNTFLRLKDTIREFYNYYMENCDETKIIPPKDLNEKNVEEYFNKTKSNVDKINTVKSYGLSLRMLIPVLGESFINFIIFLLGKDEIKSDKQKFNAITRASIYVRLGTLNLYINGLDKPIDCTNENIKNYLDIMKNRNKFLHGNIIPKENTFDDVYFDGTIPIFNKPRDINKEFSTQALFQISKEEIQSDYENINNFIKYVISCISEEYRNELKIINIFHELGWNEREQRVGILFPEEIVEFMPVFKN